MCATGHSLMKAKMRETGAVVGGELSGHIFFNERWYGFDDAIYAAARLLEILSMEPYDATQVFAEFPAKHSTPELHVAVPEARKFNVVAQFISKAQFPDGNSSDLDGLRVDFADGWGLLRASNTTPALTLRFEADSEAGLERIKAQFRSQLQAIAPELSVSF
jgi:phosphomannomutase/phosphoglucomutase